MNAPAVYYINLVFAWFLVLMSVWGFIIVLRHTGEKMLFWLFLGIGWMLLGISHILTLGGISAVEWYMLTLRIGGYAFLVISVFSLMMHIVNRDSL